MHKRIEQHSLTTAGIESNAAEVERQHRFMWLDVFASIPVLPGHAQNSAADRSMNRDRS